MGLFLTKFYSSLCYGIQHFTENCWISGSTFCQKWNNFIYFFLKSDYDFTFIYFSPFTFFRKAVFGFPNIYFRILIFPAGVFFEYLFQHFFPLGQFYIYFITINFFLQGSFRFYEKILLLFFLMRGKIANIICANLCCKYACISVVVVVLVAAVMLQMLLIAPNSRQPSNKPTHQAVNK